MNNKIGLLLIAITLIGCGKENRGIDRLTGGQTASSVPSDVVRHYPDYVEVFFYHSTPKDIFEISLDNINNKIITCYVHIGATVVTLPTQNTSVSVVNGKVTVLGLKTAFEYVDSIQVAWQ